MGLFSKDIKNMNDLFVHTLQDIYYAENQIVKALPDMVEKASDSQLKQGFQNSSARNRESREAAGTGVQAHRPEGAGRGLPGDRRHP